MNGCMVRKSLFTLVAVMLAHGAGAADNARLTVGMPAYVHHPDARSGTQGWNEGWLNNEGVLVDVTWPVKPLGEQTDLRLGVTGGAFDNSMYRNSLFAGGVVEIETRATEHLTFSLGSYAGAITGYKNEVSPAVAPYVGTAYGITDRVELGLRGFWLPAKTIGGSSIADSDAYVGAVTLGTRF